MVFQYVTSPFYRSICFYIHF